MEVHGIDSMTSCTTCIHRGGAPCVGQRIVRMEYAIDNPSSDILVVSIICPSDFLSDQR